MTRRCAAPSADDSHWSLLDVSNSGIDLAAALVEDGDLLIRLFNAEGGSTPAHLTLNSRIRKVQLVELDGRPIKDLSLEPAAGGTGSVTVTMNRFAVQTLRCKVG